MDKRQINPDLYKNEEIKDKVHKDTVQTYIVGL